MINEFKNKKDINCKFNTGCFETGNQWLKKNSFNNGNITQSVFILILLIVSFHIITFFTRI